ncbi:Vacuolar protein-sorting-associated protein 60 [Lithohypha guttulata]|uniref:Vacuolar protein-sorting-associated protein 60 n=1 Tax=Lithohypha guttulata TaxID=1690604 RepID=A0AAN7T0J9_9EURO|nr:Vacuolar protein-sorting-associated protein 60 [Lithohypha guttulata]KAK5086525.1 Vacuolar protein-sorting-associated protein 60 [Lithohypha guttulata]KAK5101707.1 Vacuolar protein-sorting-associated protein 60 [Lithohypha guttulata]
MTQPFQRLAHSQYKGRHCEFCLLSASVKAKFGIATEEKVLWTFLRGFGLSNHCVGFVLFAVTMNRLFGAKNNAPKPTLNQAITGVETRIDSIDVKLAKLNAELTTYQQKMAKMRDGPGKNAIKQRALKVLQQRKMYESQKDNLMQQSWNMEQAGMMQDNLKNVMTTVDAMKTTNKELKKQYGKIDLDKIEQIQDEMADLMEIGNEISESMGRAYDIPDDVDEAELDAELEALGEEMTFEQQAETAGGMPAFMQDEALPTFVDEPPESKKVAEPAGGAP